MIIYTRTISLLVDFLFVDVCWSLQISASVHGVCCVFGFAALSVLSFAIPKCVDSSKKDSFQARRKIGFFFCCCGAVNDDAVWLCGTLKQNCLWFISGSVLLVLFLFYFTIHYRLVLSCNINTSCCNNGVLSTGVSVIDRFFIVILFAKLVIDRQSTELLFATLFCIISSLIIHNLHRFCSFFFLHKTQFRFCPSKEQQSWN